MASSQPAVQAGESTRLRLLDTAEALFAENGIERTSLRAVTRAAGVNTAAIHYHFGSKRGLLEAVIARYAEPINQSRTSSLDRILADADGQQPSLSDILHAWFEIDHENLAVGSERQAIVARFIARLEAQPPGEVEELFRQQFGQIMARFLEAMAPLCRHLPEDQLRDRFALAVGLISQVFSGSLDRDIVPGHPPAQVSAERRLDTVIAFALAGLEAPATPVQPSNHSSSTTRDGTSPHSQPNPSNSLPAPNPVSLDAQRRRWKDTQ